MSFDGVVGTVWDHLEELRRTLIRVLATILCATVLSFAFHQQILSFLTLPLSILQQGDAQGSLTVIPYQVVREKVHNFSNHPSQFTIPSGSRLIHAADSQPLGAETFLLEPGGFLEIERLKGSDQLIVLGPVEGFRTALIACFWFALVASSPLWLFFVFQFVAPALSRKEKSMALPVISFCLLFMVLGAVFGFLVAIPLANHTLFAFNSSIGINLWTLSHYLDFTVLLLLANSLAFELCAILLLLVHFYVVTASWLSDKRRHMYVAIFILGALLTPPDVLTQLLVAIPLCIMYELVVLYAKYRCSVVRQVTNH